MQWPWEIVLDPRRSHPPWVPLPAVRHSSRPFPSPSFLPTPFPFPATIRAANTVRRRLGNLPHDTRPAWFLPPGLVPPPAYSLASTPNPMVWLIYQASHPLINAEWGSRAAGIDAQSRASTAIFSPHRALNLESWFVPFTTPSSLQPRADQLNLPVTRRIKCSRVEIRPRTPGIHSFAPGCKSPTTPGSTAVPRHTSSKKVCAFLSTLNLRAVHSGRVYSDEIPSSC